QGGAPLAAFASSQSGDREAIDDFLRQLTQPGADAALKTADRLQKTPVADLVAWLQRWLYDVLSVKLSGTIRYYPRYKKELTALAAKVEVGALLQAIKAANDRRAIAAHPLAPKLFIEDMLLDYATIFS
ncbi:MAG TPA: DNA polymerase III subunit delta' C-terminal domain-containing protein, partial [Herminiimonas sp.]|nr:DNA polymerase III subunit delta' C-terminal domain-containing protein [Herminiimonas sp.]